MSRLAILSGDCLERLPEIPDNSVHCCVTSPPYWGLRSYLPAGHPLKAKEIGLEKTPEEYVAKIVAVFREVRRVLRDDGTLWLNLGSSYAGYWGDNYAHKPFGQDRTADASTPPNKPSMNFKKRRVSRDKPTSQSPSGVPACGTDGKESQDFLGSDRVCPYCGGELLDGSEIRRDYNARNGQPNAQALPLPLPKGRDTSHSGFVSASQIASPDDAHDSTIGASDENVQGASDPATMDVEPQSEILTSSGSAQGCGHNSACTNGTVLKDEPSVFHTSGTGLFCKACGYSSIAHPQFKPKDLVPIPWMVAMALQQDGWFLRSDIIWSKRNCMPESVTDRPTKSHEYIFLLTKNARYFYDNEAVKVPASDSYANDSRWETGGTETNYKEGYSDAMAQNPKMPHRVFNGEKRGTVNLRDVWHIANQPYAGSHFATFPPDLIKPCIMAGTSSKGCCPKCGAPWERVVERNGGTLNPAEGKRRVAATGGAISGGTERCTLGKTDEVEHKTLGWQPTCEHRQLLGAMLAPVPCTVLDPFGGSGTVGQVALELGRKAILIDLNPEYMPLIESRTNVTPGLPLA